MSFDLLPIVSGTVALIFVLLFGRLRWEFTPEGRNIMLSTLAVVLVGFGEGLNVGPLQTFGYLCLSISMVYRVIILLKAQKKGRSLLNIPDES